MIVQPNLFQKLPQVPIYNNDLAAFLILKGHLLDNQNMNFKSKNRWIYWFRKDDNIYQHMDDYKLFKNAMCLIRTKAKLLDKDNKMMYNNGKDERGL